MLVQFVQFDSTLDHEELVRISRERLPRYEAIPSLRQKYYLKLAEPNRYAGLMVWDSAEALARFRESELFRTVAPAYGVVGAPEVSVHEVMFTLREVERQPA